MMTALLLLAGLVSAAAPVKGAPQVINFRLTPTVSVSYTLGTYSRPTYVMSGSNGLSLPRSLVPNVRPLPGSVVPDLLSSAPDPTHDWLAGERQLSASLQESGGENKPAEQSAAEAGKVFDGAGDAPNNPPPVDPPGNAVAVEPGGGLPSYLSVADPADGAWLADVVNVALGTRTGKKILGGIEKLSRAQNRPLTVIVTELRTNNGEYVYDWDVVRMASRYRKLDPLSAAPIFMHELLHVLQKVDGYPVGALELELEAHLISIRMINELGIKTDPDSFERGAINALKKSAEKYVAYVAKSYDKKDNRPLSDGGIRGFIGWLEKQKTRGEKSVARLERKLAKERKNVEAMRASKQPENLITTYERDVVQDLERKLVDEIAGLAWAERDLKLLNDPVSVARYRKYAARVRRMLRQAQGE